MKAFSAAFLTAALVCSYAAPVWANGAGMSLGQQGQGAAAYVKAHRPPPPKLQSFQPAKSDKPVHNIKRSPAAKFTTSSKPAPSSNSAMDRLQGM